MKTTQKEKDMKKNKTEKQENPKTDFGLMYITIFIFILCSLAVSITLFGLLYCNSNPENPKNGFTAKDYLSIAQTIAITLAVFTGAGTAGMAFRSHQIKEVDATNRRFNEAVTAMKDKDTNKYCFQQGVYALERLARNVPNKHERQNAIDILCDYLKDHCGVIKPEDEREVNLDEHSDNILKPNHISPPIFRAIANLKTKFPEVRVYLENTNFDKVIFRDCNLAKSDFGNSTFIGSRFTNVKLNSAYLVGANFRCAKFDNTTFENAYLTASIFENAECEKVSFENARLTMTYFTKANLRGANLKNTNITSAFFIESDLCGANLEGITSDREDMFFENAIVDKDTRGLESSGILKSYEINRDDPKKWILIPRAKTKEGENTKPIKESNDQE